MAAGQAENMKSSKRFLPLSAAIVIASLALGGCSDLANQLQPTKDADFSSAQDLAENWNQPAEWVPADATEIKTQEASAGGPAILAATTDTELDASLCSETDRQSAPVYSEAWSPEDVYVDSVFACGNWAVMKTDTGWYGWTPNDPDEKAVSPNK